MTDAEASLTRSLAEALRLSSQAGEQLAAEVRQLREQVAALVAEVATHRQRTEPALAAYQAHLDAIQAATTREVADAVARERAAETAAAAAEAEAEAARAAGWARVWRAVQRYVIPIILTAIAYLVGAGSQNRPDAAARAPDQEDDHASP